MCGIFSVERALKSYYSSVF